MEPIDEHSVNIFTQLFYGIHCQNYHILGISNPCLPQICPVPILEFLNHKKINPQSKTFTQKYNVETKVKAHFRKYLQIRLQISLENYVSVLSYVMDVQNIKRNILRPFENTPLDLISHFIRIMDLSFFFFTLFAEHRRVAEATWEPIVKTLFVLFQSVLPRRAHNDSFI